MRLLLLQSKLSFSKTQYLPVSGRESVSDIHDLLHDDCFNGPFAQWWTFFHWSAIHWIPHQEEEHLLSPSLQAKTSVTKATNEGSRVKAIMSSLLGSERPSLRMLAWEVKLGIVRED
jgi:hypothetical protein